MRLSQPQCCDNIFLKNSKSHDILLTFIFSPCHMKSIPSSCLPLDHIQTLLGPIQLTVEPTFTMRAFIATALCPLVACYTIQPFNTTSKSSNTTIDTTSCISTADAILIANGFGQILSNFSMSFGDILIADDYVDQSDSVATLMHSPNLLASDVQSPLSPFVFTHIY